MRKEDMIRIIKALAAVRKIEDACIMLTGKSLKTDSDLYLPSKKSISCLPNKNIRYSTESLYEILYSI